MNDVQVNPWNAGKHGNGCWILGRIYECGHAGRLGQMNIGVGQPLRTRFYRPAKSRAHQIPLQIPEIARPVHPILQRQNLLGFAGADSTASGKLRPELASREQLTARAVELTLETRRPEISYLAERRDPVERTQHPIDDGRTASGHTSDVDDGYGHDSSGDRSVRESPGFISPREYI